MTAFDIIVFFLIGSGAVFGLMRGFVQETLSMIAWILVIAAVRVLHAPATSALAETIRAAMAINRLRSLAILLPNRHMFRRIATDRA